MRGSEELWEGPNRVPNRILQFCTQNVLIKKKRSYMLEKKFSHSACLKSSMGGV